MCGPTASGKTRLAVDLALGFGGEIVSADSMQVYRGMDIGTAKPSAAERRGVPHHLLDVVEPSDSFSLVEYLAPARAAVADIAARGRLPVLAGGTGLYIQSLVDNIQFEDIAADPVHRLALEQAWEREGAQRMWERLRACDPTLAGTLHPNNRGRVLRALEVYELTGTPMSELQRRSRTAPSPYRPCMLGLCFNRRESLYERIDRRVDDMLERGLLEEAAALHARRLSATASQAIGYKELFAYFSGLCSLEEAVSLVKQSSRRYAKRQLTWLRRDNRVNWLAWEEFDGYPALLDKAARIAAQALQQEWKGAHEL